MYTAKSKFRIRNGYGCFTIPKSLLLDLGWKHGDLVEFLGLSDQIIMQRIRTREELKGLKGKKKIEYNKEWCKKIAKMGGNKEEDRTLGIKTFPNSLIKDLKLKDNKTIYFLPSSNIKDTVFIATDEEKLERLNDASKILQGNSKQKYQKYNLHYFERMRELDKKHLKYTRELAEKLERAMEILGRLRLIDDEIAYIEKWLKIIKSKKSKKFIDKKEIIERRKEYLRHLKEERKYLNKKFEKACERKKKLKKGGTRRKT